MGYGRPKAFMAVIKGPALASPVYLEISFSIQPWASPISGDQLLGTAMHGLLGRAG
jgi:hypothetical protein